MTTKLDKLRPFLVLASRLMLAQMFVISGTGMLNDPASTVGLIAAKGLPGSTVLVTSIGILELVAAAALIVGWRARWAAGGLLVFTVIASLLFHNFWVAPATQQFMHQLLFMKNMAVAGGLLLVVALGAGAWSIDNR